MEDTTQTLQQRLDRIATQLHQLDPNHHSALLFSFIGTIEGATQFQPYQMVKTIDLLERVVNDIAEAAGTQA
ncbi:hypothetical protein KQ940_19445 [Marinobacterium sp. D7]|uniref:hypothetical protein n=1 Tax=Marinobacterium ramblicola TaxID=2849041 RepID=UPI001C2DC01F|nr:hypothetical protein [Marinobacterium ramblicola]MBV1790235.1 hypothetical protein [Marinobacterium ramblicola]